MTVFSKGRSPGGRRLCTYRCGRTDWRGSAEAAINCIMLMQLWGAVREAESSVLGDLARLRFVRLRSRAFGAGDTESVAAWRESVGSVVGDADAGTVVLVQLPAAEFLSRHQVATVHDEVAAHRERNGRASGECYTLIGAAFEIPESALQEEVAEDLAFVWQRVTASRMNAGCPGLAMVAVLHGSVMRVLIEAPVRSATERLARHLLDLPVVSSELLAKRCGEEGVPSHRWSQRLARLKEVGLLMPIAPQLARARAVQQAHAAAVGRSVDRRRTRLYRSVVWDLVRRGGSSPA